MDAVTDINGLREHPDSKIPLEPVDSRPNDKADQSEIWQEDSDPS